MHSKLIVSILIIAAIVSPLPGSAQQTTSWQSVYPYPTGGTLYSVHAFSTDSVIALGNGNISIRSADGGNRWEIADYLGGKSTGAINASDFPTPARGFAVGTDGLIVTTSDGGTNWRRLSSGTTTTLKGVDFIDENTGVVVGSSASGSLFVNPVILRTIDGGENWSSVSCPTSLGLVAVAFGNGSNGVAVGDSGVVIRTTDGGVTWFYQDRITASRMNDVKFIDDTTVVAIGGSCFYRSGNAGVSWSSTCIGSIGGYGNEMYSISFFDANRGILGARRRIFATTDGGITWTNWELGKFNQFRSVSMVSPTDGYAVGNSGIILKTVDGGFNWTYVSSEHAETFTGAFFTSASKGTVVGANSRILQTTDAGVTWINRTHPSSGSQSSMREVAFVDEDTGMVVGDLPNVMVTHDGGETWGAKAVPTPNFGNSDLYMFNGSEGFVVGSKGSFPNYFPRILYTSDGGTNWSEKAHPYADSSGDFPAIDFADGSVGLVAGVARISGSPLLLRTSDGGATWTGINSGLTKATFRDLLFLDSQNVLAIAIDNATTTPSIAILKSTDAGLTWTEKDHPLTQARTCYKMSFSDPSTGMIATNAGAVLLTNDGGETWTSQILPTNYLADLHLISNGTGLTGFGVAQGIFYTAFSPLPAKHWTGSADSSWDNAANWDPVGVPGPGDSVVILPSGTNPVIILPHQQIVISSLNIRGAGRLEISEEVSKLIVLGDVEIRGVLKFRSGASTKIMCGRNWKNKPSGFAKTSAMADEGFLPSTTTVFLSGQGEIEGNFYDLVIDTASSMRSLGNVAVEHRLTLLKSLTLRPQDTLFIQSAQAQTFLGSGKIVAGTIARMIEPTSTEAYQFESASTYVQFDNTGGPPTSITMTAYPDTVPSDFGDVWVRLESLVDTVLNTVTATGVGEFSKWAVRSPRPGLKKGTTGADEEVRRLYSISQTGATYFSATLSLRYEDSEVPSGVPEDSLSLWRLLGTTVLANVFPKWNLVSLPVDPQNDSVAMVFPTAKSDAYSFEPTGYQVAPILSAGNGYWLKFDTTENVILIGERRNRDTLYVNQGWNLVGSLTYPVAANSVFSDPPGIIAGAFFGYRGAYQIADSLLPMGAYWIKASNPGSIILDANQSSPGSRQVSKSFASSCNKLTITDAAGIQHILYVASASQAAAGLSKAWFALPPDAPEQGFTARFEGGGIVEILDARSDNMLPIPLGSAQFPISIAWTSQDRHLTPEVIAGDVRATLSEDHRVVLRESVDRLILKVSGEGELPTEYALHQNYPNPFNPVTQIRFDIPERSHVVLRVYNILGQEIATLIDRELNAGFESVSWDATGFPSGAYYYRLTSGRYSAVKTMMLLK